jgi:CBS domain-containing protein
MSSTEPTPTDFDERLARLPVRSAMQLGLFTSSPDDPISSVAQTMAEQSIHCVVVAGIARRDHAGEHISWGIVSDLDLMGALHAGTATATAGQVAGSEIVTISPRDSLALAAGLMAEHQTAHLVVVSPETARPVGMLSTLDVARAIDRG